MDRSVFSRDIIDLAMMSLPKKILQKAADKASAAYGNSVLEDLDKTITMIQETKGWLDECINVLAIDLPKAVVWNKIRNLRKVYLK